MKKSRRIDRRHWAVAAGAAILGLAALAASSPAQQATERPAYVIVERTATTGPESIQQDYAKRAREILPNYGGHYLARSQQNALLEGDGEAPCCIAILEFPSLDAAKRWYASAENQATAKIRQGGARFRLVALEGLARDR